MAETEQVGGAGMQRAGEAGAGVTWRRSAAEKALAMATAMRERLMAMPAGKRTWLIASVVFLAAMCAGMIWFAGRPDWRVLFSGLDGKDVQQVSQELAAAGIPYETTADGRRSAGAGGDVGQGSYGGSGEGNAADRAAGV